MPKIDPTTWARTMRPRTEGRPCATCANKAWREAVEAIIKEVKEGRSRATAVDIWRYLAKNLRYTGGVGALRGHLQRCTKWYEGSRSEEHRSAA